jgi:hypothetical protein
MLLQKDLNMNEWKDLDIGNIPSDFFVNEDYEYKYNYDNNGWIKSNYTSLKERGLIISNLTNESFKYRYRLKDNEVSLKDDEVSLKDIESKWWNYEGVWHKIVRYVPGRNEYIFYSFTANREWFKTAESIYSLDRLE